MSADEMFDMSAARKLWDKKQLQPKKATREKRHRQLADGVDKRSLRATGRTEQFNIRAKSEVKAAAFQHAERMGYDTVAEFIEAAILAFIEKGGAKNA